MLYPVLRRTERAPNMWDEFFNMRNEFDRLWASRPGGDFAWMPSVDIRETEDNLLVEAELPGLAADDVDVRVENGVLTISGEKQHEVREGKEGKEDASYHLFERRYGRFERSFSLPQGVDADHVEAAFANGVLTVTLPKAERAKPRKIAIKSGNGASRKIESK